MGDWVFSSSLDCICKTPDDLKEVCRWILDQKKNRTVVFLQGDLGAGKTELVRQFVEAIGSKEVSSPTFSIINHYAGNGLSVVHVDLYRIESEADLESTGFWEIWNEPTDLVFLEWPERLASLDTIDQRWQKILVKIEIQKSLARKITAEVYS